MIEPDALWVSGSLLWPPWLAERAVHIPLHELDVMLGEQGIERCKHPFPHFFPCKIEHKLVAPLGARPVAKVVHPIRMRTVQITVWIHHLRFDPQAKTHP